jgi:hypothetical protein
MLIGGGGGGPTGSGGNTGSVTPGLAFGTFVGITNAGAEIAEKIFRPDPEYTKLSVLNIADSSSVGSKLDDVLAIRFAATPGAVACPVACPVVCPARPFPAGTTATSVSSRLLPVPVTGALTRGAVAAGFGDPPKKLSYAYATNTSSSNPNTEYTTIFFVSLAGAALMAGLPSAESQHH